MVLVFVDDDSELKAFIEEVFVFSLKGVDDVTDGIDSDFAAELLDDVL